MLRPTSLLIVVVAALSGLPGAWGAAPEQASDVNGAATFDAAQIEYFEKHVRPLLATKCVECHGPELQEAGLRLDSRGGVLHGMEGTPAAVPGDPSRSRLIAVVKYDGDVQMPPDGKLPDDQLAVLTNWVKLGLPWPAESAAPATTTTKPTTSAAENAAWIGSMDDRIARARAEHWAFQPVVKPTPPEVSSAAWSQNPVDRFVFAKLSEAGLAPSPEADPRTLIRRLHFDLVGLPPTPAEIDAFTSDHEADAFSALVDKLLASPQYGERWARHWLDLARYADTKGYAFQQERRFPFAYTYRDYVIQAFNEDKPYDQFILEQLAADKLPSQPNNRHLAAMGFITCGRQYQGVHDTLDDQIDVVTRGLLGLTVSCARCHDHKFDPVPTADYYSLYGVFRSSTVPGELPALGEPTPSPEYDAFRQELAQLTAERDAFVNEQLTKLTDELRSHATDYLAKVVIERLGNDLKDADYLFDEGDPRPTIVRRWRDLLTVAKRRPDSVFGIWHRFDALKEAEFADEAPKLAAAIVAEFQTGKAAAQHNRIIVDKIAEQPPQSMLDVAKCYGAALEQAEAEWKRLLDPKSRKIGEPAPTALPDAAAEQLRQVLYCDDSPTIVTFADARSIFDRKVRNDAEAKQKKIDQLVVTSAGAPPRAMSLVDLDKPFDPKVFLRGDASRSGPAVPRQFLKLLTDDATRLPFADGSGRLGLAQAIASRDNPLTARVMVNRIWMLHFGRGLVDTPSDFGVRTPPPSHPELLDYLAAEFMDEGWSVKHIHRLIVTSQTYRQSSAPAERASANRTTAELMARAASVDPENRLLWRMNRRRIEFEAMRDAMLAVAGRLDLQSFGRPVELWKSPYPARRTVYGYIDRQDLPGVFGVFDFANPDVTIDQRPRTTVPQQALFAMNSPFVQEQARHVAARSEIAAAADDTARTTALFRTVFGRPPTDDEAARVARFIDQVRKSPHPASTEVWQYGYGPFDVEAGRVESFTSFAHWTGSVWQIGAKMPDAERGHVSLRAGGGHPGHNAKTAAIMRWTAPQAGEYSVDGTLKHPSKEGNGVAAHIVSPRLGKLGTWTAEHDQKKTAVAKIELQAGDVLDFVVESRGTDAFDSYDWSPTIRLSKDRTVWSAADDFHGPTPTPLSPWEMSAQVLLMSNEFMFVD